MSVGSNDLFSIQARAALMNKELKLKELEQIIITGTQYCGYPKFCFKRNFKRTQG